MAPRVPVGVQSRLGSLGRFFGADVRQTQRSESKRLLTVTAPELWGPNKIPPAEAWAVAISTEIAEGFAVNNTQVVPLKARIAAMAGGVQHFFELDAFPSAVIPVFAPSLTVDIFWEATPENVAPVLPFQFPAEVVTRATAQQANLNGQATVSFLQNSGPALVRTVTVPPFVDRFAIRGTTVDTPFSAATIVQVGSGDASGGGFPLLEMTGAQMLTVVQDGRWVMLPGKAGAVGVSLSGVSTDPWFLEFGMKF